MDPAQNWALNGPMPMGFILSSRERKPKYFGQRTVQHTADTFSCGAIGADKLDKSSSRGPSANTSVAAADADAWEARPIQTRLYISLLGKKKGHAYLVLDGKRERGAGEVTPCLRGQGRDVTTSR